MPHPQPEVPDLLSHRSSLVELSNSALGPAAGNWRRRTWSVAAAVKPANSVVARPQRHRLHIRRCLWGQALPAVVKRTQEDCPSQARSPCQLHHPHHCLQRRCFCCCPKCRPKPRQRLPMKLPKRCPAKFPTRSPKKAPNRFPRRCPMTRMHCESSNLYRSFGPPSTLCFCLCHGLCRSCHPYSSLLSLTSGFCHQPIYPLYHAAVDLAPVALTVVMHVMLAVLAAKTLWQEGPQLSPLHQLHQRAFALTPKKLHPHLEEAARWQGLQVGTQHLPLLLLVRLAPELQQVQ
mmetsp:Transcript_19630/g.49057  ORF Transcript_19630/g.49057 Transcript_19630/m.49057 type:complete len:290 (-) Transcript_19630:196-1065(-)